MSEFDPNARTTATAVATPVPVYDSGYPLTDPMAQVPEQPTAKKRRPVAVIALSAALVLALAGGATATTLLVQANIAADARAAEEAAEDERQADGLAAVAEERDDARAAQAVAEDQRDAANARAEAAGDRAEEAEAQLAEVEAAASSSGDIDDGWFLDTVSSFLPGVPDAELIDLAHSTCDVIDSGSVVVGAEQAVFDAIDIARDAGGMSQDDAIAWTSAAIVAYCPEHGF